MNERRFHFVRVDPNLPRPEIVYELLQTLPNKIETWTKTLPTRVDGVTPVLSLASMDHGYCEKAIADKWVWDFELLASEKINGRGEVTFKYVSRDRYEVTLTYYGNALISRLARITNVTTAQEVSPIRMQGTVAAELENTLLLDMKYDVTELKDGYEKDQLENRHLKLMLEEEVEQVLEENGIEFADDGRTFCIRCDDCGGLPCVWESNRQGMIDYDDASNQEEAQPNQRRHRLYKQMALIINEGPSGRGIRIRLPACVVTGIRSLFADPDGNYTGHRDIE